MAAPRSREGYWFDVFEARGRIFLHLMRGDELLEEREFIRGPDGRDAAYQDGQEWAAEKERRQ